MIVRLRPMWGSAMTMQSLLGILSLSLSKQTNKLKKNNIVRVIILINSNVCLRKDHWIPQKVLSSSQSVDKPVPFGRGGGGLSLSLSFFFFFLLAALSVLCLHWVLRSPKSDAMIRGHIS